MAHSPIHWIIATQGFPTPGKSPTAQNLQFPTWRNPRPAYGNNNLSYWGNPQMVGVDLFFSETSSDESSPAKDSVLLTQTQPAIPKKRDEQPPNSACILHIQPDAEKTPQNRNIKALPFLFMDYSHDSQGVSWLLFHPVAPIPPSPLCRSAKQ